MELKKFLFKVIIVGDGGVGKSTMVQRLVTGKFIPMKITIGTDLKMYTFQLEGNLEVSLQIWDFAGEKRFRTFLPKYSSGATGCLLCYDITRISSFQNLPEWYDIVSKNALDPVLIMVGGKLDLANESREVKTIEAENFQKEYNLNGFFETSSKSGENNRIIFEALTREILKKKT